VTDFLAEKRKEISDRLTALQPQVDEYNRLAGAVEALAGILGTGTTAVRPRNGRRRRRGRPAETRGSKATTVSPQRPSRRVTSTHKPAAPRGRPGRRKGSGSRAAEAYSHVTGQPGITIPELAAKMGIKQNYLYRVMPSLEQEKKVHKKGRGWHPTADA
jgi:hypothetical protein